MVLGNNRPYVTLLVRPHLPALEDLAAQLHLTFADAAELPSRPEILEEIKSRRRPHRQAA